MKVKTYNKFQEPAPATIKPRGHLQEFLERQKSGLTGHFTEMGYPFDTTMWVGKIANVHFTEAIHHGKDIPVDPSGAWWPYEQSAYLLDGALRLSFLIEAPELRELYRKNLDWLVTHPDAKGMLGHEYHSSDSEWPLAVFFKSAMAWVEGTQDETAKQAFVRHYAALPMETLALPGRNITNLEGVLKAYEWSGDCALLKKAVAAYERNNQLAGQSDAFYGDLYFDLLAAGRRLVLHGVSFAEMLKLPVILYGYTGDRKWLDGAQFGLDCALRDHEQPSGVPSSNEFLSGRDPLQGFETCVTADLLWSLGYFIQADGAVRYADRMEKIAYNALPGAVTKDFTNLQYLSTANQVLATPFSNNSHFQYGETTWRQYRPAHFPQCCPGNLHRAMPAFVMRMWLLEAATGAPAAMLYGPSAFACTYKGTAVRIEERTEYPFAETIEFKFNMGKTLDMPFTFRIPEWCSAATAMLNGKTLALKLKPGTLVTCRQRWKNGDVLTLTLPMPVVLKRDRQWCWFERGPLTFAYAVPHQETREGAGRFASRTLTPTAPWNYAVGLDAADLSAVKLVKKKSAYPFATPALELRVPVSRISGYDALAEGRLTPAVPLYYKTSPERETVALQPYGTTLTRITAFPDQRERSPLPVVAAAAVGPYPYNQRLPLAAQVFEPESWDDETFLRHLRTKPVQRNADFYFDLERHYRLADNHLAYVQFRFWSDAATTATFALGASSAAQCFLDGRELFVQDPLHEAELMAPQWFDAPVRRGYNYLLVKVACAQRCGQYRGAWGAKLDVFVNR